ncbi:MAG: site-specific integrase [Methylophaga sp.]|nr:site-specific integrase [Methylophaga sp.]
MKVTIQKRKGKEGILNLRLEFYHGYTKNSEGKIKHQREYENLNGFLYAKPKTPAERTHNKQSLQLAEAIRAKRVVEAQNSQHGFKDAGKVKANFIDYFQRLCDEKGINGSQSNYSIWISTLKHLKSFHGKKKLTFEQITKEFVVGFRDYLQNEPITKGKEKLSPNTASTYFSKFRAALNQAFKDEIITKNPIKNVDPIKLVQNKREYLTLEELKAVGQTECRYDVLKRAFLFSCLTGLRWSDIHKLTWSQCQAFDGGYRITFHQQKTEALQYLDISDQAFKLMGLESEPDEKVFKGLRYDAYHNLALAKWCMKAGITKNITFHCARHTFAVLQLTMGTDIYTVSKLLGHSELKTTQIYADIIDKNRQFAMNKMPDIGL